MCGATMNRHAEKLVDPVTAEELGRIDPELGGVVHELHTCPICGTNTSRPGALVKSPTAQTRDRPHEDGP